MTPFDKAAAAGRQAAHASRHRKAAEYVRDARTLFYWTFPSSRETIAICEVNPHSSRHTRELCHALYRDIQTAKALPKYIEGKRMTINELRTLFTCECGVYRRQRASIEAQRDMNAFQRGLVP